MRKPEISKFLKDNPRKKLRKIKGDNTITTKDEVWIDRKGYEGTYIISNKGNFKKYERRLTLDGEILITENIDLKQWSVKNKLYHLGEYWCVALFNQRRPVKMLVAQNFFENPLDYRYIKNIDGNAKNNAVDNLEYTDLSEVRYNEEKVIRGSKQYQAKLTEEDVIDILKRFKNGEKAPEIQKIYPIHIQNLYRIKYGRIWRHITSPEARKKLKL